MSTYTQQDFRGGMNQIADDTQLAENEYRLLINGRNRLGPIKPIMDSVLIPSPRGNCQGITAVGGIVVVFISGQAYYKSLDNNTWNLIGDFQMSPTVDYIYNIFVNSSTVNNKRLLNAANDAAGSVTLAANFSVSGTPAGLLCQDGINQPWIIFYDSVSNSARARKCKTYAEWSNDATGADSREYVPIGRRMFQFSSILFIEASDGFTIYRSVTGRPLDFMVNIDLNGNKLANEQLGGAGTTSFSCGFNAITYMGPLDDTHFMVGTALNTYSISLDFTNTQFAEPTFATPQLFMAGIVNHFSVTDKSGDWAFIDFDAVKSFNGVQQFKFKGDNDPFSLQVAKLFIDPVTNKPIRQQVTAATSFDNYNFFSVLTRLGYALLVWDNFLNKWIGLDITGAVKIKQFAITYTTTEQLLFAITATGKVYQLFANPIRATCIMDTGSFITSDAKVKHKSVALRPVFQLGTSSGQILVNEVVDDKRNPNYLTLPLTGITCGVKPPIIPPVMPDTDKLTDNKTFTFRDGEEGFKISYCLRWNTEAELKFLEVETSGIYTQISKEQLSTQLASFLAKTTSN